ncbi:MAG: hypothetical protein A2312_01905 [Candidatus Staskawiczbacteria bacterium RIFOXYB2_FULL_32_9]|uniref:Uncharacterized protein n=1 Tax=Candidatus Staskawiczbacteria bacterium RIFOXYD1_FULL_32_13 TaxID=1802234 RepID=A0A1G2JN67_9BACT|nr:MAG: hypothetical protein UR22_C0001G0107 [Parcubacteria group bacterium GW2011_GWC2_32_10]OGZ77825.1 MAG: hypothetical protein A2360_04475 [Candidatus Staskawiczbacteria bacterium RIFOXYB1_FULL_32_11]OGZ82124.1 MAG: hypothetical protein A2312_01905 [Candidatus Staskawiczbacteria bacterium RIFOXYB2_FULL_32_9]OGZ87288.1 MAG: hypothetical protein A2463_02915 [Candidatus Staskawiczbacteria bacterium RIFOXYC2_FULL_32_10]OGZ87740.1 MAG: hypothetical protein A2561_03550 [Candidatus Staskawiczbacte
MEFQNHSPEGSGQAKNCQNCKKDFTIEPDDFAFYEKIKVPVPTFCSECRMQRRLLFRSERFLYKRKSDFSGKEIFSMWPQESDTKVYENSVWFSDKWDALEHGKDYDFSKPFFEQLLDLRKNVPIYALSTTLGVDSDYCNNFTALKNCYLVFSSNYSEDCMYGTGINHSKNCIDNIKVFKSENCHENFFVNSSFNVFFSAQCSDSMNIWFCKDCVGCNDCIGCIGLRNKSYYIFNKPYTKEEYQAEFQKFNFASYQAMKDFSKKVHEFWLKFPVKYMQGLKNSNVSGEYIKNSKNVLNSYLVSGGENLRYCSEINVEPVKDCYDYSVWGDKAELVYECMSCGLGVNNIKFCAECWPDFRDSEYSLFCQSSSNLFGCVGVRKKEYCILNKQYTKEEYERLKEKIIKHMKEMPYKDASGMLYSYGEFFPGIFSGVFYNNSLAHEHFPLTKTEAERKGYFWKDETKRAYVVTKKYSDLPDDIKEVPVSITSEIISCQEWEENQDIAVQHNCTEGFRILVSELEFYKKFSLPLPRRCPNCRYHERIKWRNPMKLWHRKCMKPGCNNEFETSYAPDRPEIVYCETCYNNEVA